MWSVFTVAIATFFFIVKIWWRPLLAPTYLILVSSCGLDAMTGYSLGLLTRASKVN